MTQEITWVLALILVLRAGWMDWRSSRIPNWLTVPGFLIGLLVNIGLNGTEGAWTALAGAGLALGVLLPFVLLRGLGAGDWKLMGALGALLGPGRLVVVLLGTALLTGLLGMIQITRARQWRTTLGHLKDLVLMFLTFGRRARPELTIENPGLMKLPFGTAAAAATAFCYGMIRI
jgi:prepilin peptidase CpaA